MSHSILETALSAYETERRWGDKQQGRDRKKSALDLDRPARLTSVREARLPECLCKLRLAVTGLCTARLPSL